MSTSNNKLNIRPIDNESLTMPYRFSHEGYSGETSIRGFSINNNSPNHVYTNLKASIVKIGDVEILSADFFTENRWSIKLISKNSKSYPTEEEWSEVLPNTESMLEDIGIVDDSGGFIEADLDTTQFLFVRVFCPGHSEPGQYNHEISLTYNSINLTT